MRKPDETLKQKPFFDGLQSRMAKGAQIRDRKRKAGQNAGGAPTYVIGTKEFPDHSWFSLDTASVTKRIHAACTNTEFQLKNFKCASPELVRLLKSVQDGKIIPRPDPVVIAMTGGQGNGKSTLINSLLSRRGIAATSPQSRACTSFATKYVWKSGAEDSTETSDVLIVFANDEQLADAIDKHLGQYLYHYYLNDGEAGDIDDECAFETAKEFLEVIFDTKNRSNKKQFDLHFKGPKSEDVDIPTRRVELLTLCLDRARMLIRDVQAGDDRTLRFTDIMDIRLDECRRIANNIFPLVDHMVISTGALILRHGIVLIDLPGFGDVNQTRVAHANRFRRQAHYELIVMTSDRLETQVKEADYIRQSIDIHGADHTILIINKIDHFFMDSNNDASVLLGQDKEPFKTMDRYLDEAETQIADDMQYEKYQKYINMQAQRHELYARIRNLETTMLEKFPGVQVFSTAASQYMSWLDSCRQIQPFLLAVHTGIPEIRQFLLSLPAKSNLSTYREHVFEKMEDIKDDMLQVLARYERDDSYADIIYDLKQKIPTFEESLKSNFDSALHKCLPKIWLNEGIKQTQQTKIKNVVLNKWGSNKWNTYLKTVREYGIPIRSRAKRYVKKKDLSVNWNKMLLDTMIDHIRKWEKATSVTIETYLAIIDAQLKCFMNEVYREIEQNGGNPGLKDAARRGWIRFDRRITALSTSLKEQSFYNLKEVFQLATVETDIGCLIARMLADSYEHAAMSPKGKGSHGRRKAIMEQATIEPHIKGKTFLERFELTVTEKLMEELVESFDKFRLDVVAQSKEWVEITEDQLLTAYDPTESDLDAIAWLKEYLPQFTKELKGTQDLFPKPQDEDEDAENLTHKKAKVSE